MFGYGTTILIISNEEMNDIIKIVRSLEESGLLIKGVSKTIKNEVNKQKGGFLRILLGTLGDSLSGSLLTGKNTNRTSNVKIKAGQEFNATSSLNKFWNTKVLS